jgi:septum formation protein
MKRKIILASGSPRRKELLEKIGLPFEVVTSPYEEDMSAAADPLDLVQLLALKKAEAVAASYEDAIVIAADTFVIFENKFLGKPKDKHDAARMLRLLSGNENDIVTGYAVIDTKSGKVSNGYSKATVKIRQLTDAEIDAYIESGEPLDKAGAFAVQDLGSVLIERIDGDFYSILGLPLFKIYFALRDLGVDALLKNY